MSATHVTNL